jgi:hypothetical protein
MRVRVSPYPSFLHNEERDVIDNYSRHMSGKHRVKLSIREQSPFCLRLGHHQVEMRNR